MQNTDSAPGDKHAAQQRHSARETGSRGLAPSTTRADDGPMGYGPRGPADPSDPEPHIFRGED